MGIIKPRPPPPTCVPYSAIAELQKSPRPPSCTEEPTTPMGVVPHPTPPLPSLLPKTRQTNKTNPTHPSIQSQTTIRTHQHYGTHGSKGVRPARQHLRCKPPRVPHKQAAAAPRGSLPHDPAQVEVADLCRRPARSHAVLKAVYLSLPRIALERLAGHP